MTTPPRVHHAELAAALARIAGRRAKIDDEAFVAVDADDPRAVLDHLWRDHPRLPRWVRQADVNDALILHVWNWWEDRRRERDLLTIGVELGLPLAQLGTPLGLGRRGDNAREGTRNRLDRLAALLRFDRPDEQLVREERRLARGEDARTAWVTKHRDWIAAVTAGLLAHDQVAGDEATEWLIELRADWTEDKFTPATISLLGLAAGALRASPAVLELDPRHAAHRALRAVDDLRTSFSADLGNSPTTASTEHNGGGGSS